MAKLFYRGQTVNTGFRFVCSALQNPPTGLEGSIKLYLQETAAQGRPDCDLEFVQPCSGARFFCFLLCYFSP